MTSNEYTFELGEVFHGPMDLLLHLVREQEVEIHEVRLLDVVSGYFEHLNTLKELNIEVAGEYMVIAATLMAIKSRSLLPREEVELEDDLDPEDELIQRLLEYRRFKGAADDLEDRLHRRNQEHFRGVTNEASQYKEQKTLDMGELTSFDLLAVFSRLMRETLAGKIHTIKGDPRPLRWYVSCLGDAIIKYRTLSLRSLLTSFDEEVTKEGLIGAFCALLELVKLGIVTADQDSGRDEIRVSLCENTEGDLDDLMRASRFMDEEEEEPDGSGFKDAPKTDSEISEASGPDESPKNEVEDEELDDFEIQPSPPK